MRRNLLLTNLVKHCSHNTPMAVEPHSLLTLKRSGSPCLGNGILCSLPQARQHCSPQESCPCRVAGGEGPRLPPRVPTTVAIDPGDIDGPLPPQGKVEWCPLTGRGKLSKAGAYLPVVSHAHCQHSHPRPTTVHHHPGDAKAHHTMMGKDKDDAMRQQRLWQLLSFIGPVHMAGVGAAPQ